MFLFPKAKNSAILGLFDTYTQQINGVFQVKRTTKTQARYIAKSWNGVGVSTLITMLHRQMHMTLFEKEKEEFSAPVHPVKTYALFFL